MNVHTMIKCKINKNVRGTCMFLRNVTSHVVLFSGGKVLFDEKDVELKSENILIVGGGILQVI